MRRIVRFLKRLFLVLIALIGLFAIAVVLFLKLAPQIGQIPEGEDLERISASPNWKDGKFVNLTPTAMATFSAAMKTMSEYFNTVNTSPDDSLEVRFGESRESIDSLTYITWYGHSSFLMELNGKKILIDPMLGDYAAPIPFGSKRFPYKKAIPIAELKEIDVVIFSHDHYDHLDYPTVLAIKEEVQHWYTALGVGSHLKKWGVEAASITELDWWQETQLEDLKLVACPSRHFSGRSMFSQSTSQWASWVIQSDNVNLYFSGDGGYGTHFQEIGAKYGPFDFAMMECGQYNTAWSEIHMMPEESVLAGVDLRAELIMPIHWGAFQLAMHSWTDPIERFKAKAKELDREMIHPMIGERFALETDRPRSEWWLN